LATRRDDGSPACQRPAGPGCSGPRRAVPRIGDLLHATPSAPHPKIRQARRASPANSSSVVTRSVVFARCGQSTRFRILCSVHSRALATSVDDRPDDHPARTGPVQTRRDGRPTPPEQARCVWTGPDGRRSPAYGSGGWWFESLPARTIGSGQKRLSSSWPSAPSPSTGADRGPPGPRAGDGANFATYALTGVALAPAIVALTVAVAAPWLAAKGWRSRSPTPSRAASSPGRGSRPGSAAWLAWVSTRSSATQVAALVGVLVWTRWWRAWSRPAQRPWLGRCCRPWPPRRSPARAAPVCPGGGGLVVAADGLACALAGTRLSAARHRLSPGETTGTFAGISRAVSTSARCVPSSTAGGLPRDVCIAGVGADTVP
jgi:hypothetical protein